MSNKHTLSASPRTVIGRAVKSLRSQGLTPANVFGKNVSSLNVQVNTKDFQKLFSQAGESTLVYLEVDKEKEPRPVLVRDVVKHPVTSQLLHISFNQVDLKEKVTAPVPLELVGEAPAESSHLGILVQQLDEVEVEALPTDMPERLEMDISSLTEVGSSLSVSDLKVSQKLTLVTPADTLIVKIEPLAKEEVAPAPAAPAEGEGEGAAAEGEPASDSSEPAAEAESAPPSDSEKE